MSYFAACYRKQLLESVPNFTDLTAAQMQHEYLQFRAKAVSQEKAQTAFNAAPSKGPQWQLANAPSGNSGAGRTDPIGGNYGAKQSSHDSPSNQMHFLMVPAPI